MNQQSKAMDCERLSKHVRLCSSLAQAGSQNAAEGVHVFPSLVGVVKQTEGVPLFSPRSELILRIEGGGRGCSTSQRLRHSLAVCSPSTSGH